ncbi:hypothetical protein CGZ93_03720 [Enemella dayhoffiae]|uniref:PH domain-containing protein n=1 Tax=Enemella dayhoffiae TaxID=2016507 RepID=A0A255HA74_9ACTN|nr:hypothetical protein [Enemella dayhoffiae]OYO24505.1 hypothetical protein CGZ93_03720 [Enemella dayhoffiae]
MNDAAESGSAPTRTIDLASFNRILFLLALLLVAAAAGAWIIFTQRRDVGTIGTVLMVLAAVAVALTTGPPHRIRQLRTGSEGLELLRYTRVRTRIPAGELASTAVSEGELVLTPRHPAAFFAAHPELRPARDGDTVRLGLGTKPDKVAEVAAALG